MTNRRLRQIDIGIIITTCLIFISGSVLLKVSLIYGFTGSICSSYIFFMRKGFTIRELLCMTLKGLKECKVLYVLILLIGATVSIWLSSGVVPAMIYYGFEYMKGMNFLFVAFLIVSVSAVFMGTAVGTVSTIGVAILGIGKGFEIPSYILLGVIISGAFIADKISPISGLLNLALSSTKTSYKEALKSMLVTLIPTFILSSVIYYFLGSKYRIGSNTSNILDFQNAINSEFFVSPWLLVVPILIVLMSFLGVKIIYSTLSGLLAGSIISFIFQRVPIIEIMKTVLWGYRGNTSSEKLNEILISGGVASMLEVLLIIMGVIALSSVLEGTGVINYVTNKAIAGINSRRELVLKTGLISSILTIVTCDQTLGIVLPGRLLKDKYSELKLNHNILVRTISDTGTIIAPLMPWNINSLIIGIIAGISATKYAPFAVLCYISPIITLIFSFAQSKSTYKTIAADL